MAAGDEEKVKAGEEGKPGCSIVMPISATSDHGAAHWEEMLILLRRAILKAGMEPLPVWTGSATDRITSRILSNLFAAPVVVCDITDMNANVMLELGMRLASKKPTIVICEPGQLPPFDIKDFHAISYPKNLSILATEQFLDELTTQIKDKNQAFGNATYRPFLADVADLEVLELSPKEVPFEKFVTDRLDDITARLSVIGSVRQYVPTRKQPIANPAKSIIEVKVPRKVEAEAQEIIRTTLPFTSVLTFEEDNEGCVLMKIVTGGDPGVRDAIPILASRINRLGGQVTFMIDATPTGLDLL